MGIGGAGQGCEHPQEGLFVGVEARIDGVDRHQRGQDRTAGAGRHQVSDRHFEAADAAIDGCAHLGPVELEAGGLKAGFGGAQIGGRLAVGIDALVEVALRHVLGVPQLPAAIELAPGEGEPGLGGEHLRFGAGHRGRIGGGIDGEEEIAPLHQRALDEMHRLDGAGDARTDVDPLDRFQPAGKLVPQRDIASLQGRDRHRRGGWRLIGGSIGMGRADDRREDREPPGHRGDNRQASAEEESTRGSCHELAPSPKYVMFAT